MGSDETHAVGQESDHLARLFAYGSRRVREMPVGREWALAAVTIAAAFAEFAKLAFLAIPVLAVCDQDARADRGQRYSRFLTRSGPLPST